MRIAEIYASLQGEGLLAGTPSTFVRTSGCNLRCRWCDTPFTSWHPEGGQFAVREVVAAVAALGGHHAVVTGGEPLLFPEVAELCRELRNAGVHVTIETAGTVFLDAPADLMSISPKLGSSTPWDRASADWADRHERSRRRDDVILALMRGDAYQLKFVIDCDADFTEAVTWLEALDAIASRTIDRRRVLFMPQGTTADELTRATDWLAPRCAAIGVRLAPRHHIAWFGAGRGR